MSRLKSAPAASRAAAGRPAAGRPAARSTTAGARGVYVQSPKSDIFVVLLAISLGAILIGCLLLALVMARYDFKTKPTAMNSGSPAAGLAMALSEKQEPVPTVRL